MAQAYWSEGLVEEATFEVFFREMPAERNYMVAAGLDDVLRAAETLHFTSGELAYLSKLGCFNPSFLDYLADIRFTGEIWSVPEGTPIFPNEPVVQVVAPLIQGQLLDQRRSTMSISRPWPPARPPGWWMRPRDAMSWISGRGGPTGGTRP